MKEAMSMSDFVSKRVTEFFGSGRLYCAETVVAIMAEAGGRDSSDIVRMATGFCSGGARTDGQCGAVSGAIMGLGLYAGRRTVGEDYEPVYVLVQEFMERFDKQYESLSCTKLCGCNLASDAGRMQFKQKRVVETCIEIAVFAIETALGLLQEHGFLPDENESLKSRLAPCGLLCGKCLAYESGPIQLLSVGLAATLGDSFGVYAERFRHANPVFAQYPAFREMLDFFSRGSCTGCRGSGGLFRECAVSTCVVEHGVDYCYQCEYFPCGKHGMPEALAAVWKSRNEAMRELGPEEWCHQCQEQLRYP